MAVAARVRKRTTGLRSITAMMIVMESLGLTAISLELSTRPMETVVVLVAGVATGSERAVVLFGRLRGASSNILTIVV